MTHRPAEVQVILDGYTAVLAGESVSEVARRFTAAGLPTPQGSTTWSRGAVKDVLTNPRHAGLRRHRTADDRADIYAFGICCYEMLTFHKPYEGEKIEQVRAAQIDPKTPPVPIRQHTPNVPAALASLVMKCIAKNPADRYPDMVLVLRDLNRLA